MKLIFWGLILVFFDFNLNFGSSSISLLPAFVGYILIRKGMEKVEDCETYERARPLVLAAAILSAVIWVLNCLGMSASGWLGLVLSLAGSVLQLLVTYKIARGVRVLEAVHGWDLYGRSLMTAWIVVLVWVVLSRLMDWLGAAPIAMIALIAAFVFMIYYLFRFHKSRRAYEEYEACRED